jgi:CDP-diacylglycerol--glycerol-3-phosphate 3-phosphatidyltransferase
VFDGRFRSGVDRAVRPAGEVLRRAGLTPDQLTAFGLLLSLPAAWAIATGRLGLGLGLLIASAVPDLLDGALAKAAGTASTRGAFFDSVADRVSDAIVLVGVAWYVQSHYRGHLGLLPVGVLGASMLVSYERAKAESLGYSARGGIMERAERVVVLCAGLAWSFLLVPFLWVMLGLSVLTALQRFAKVWAEASFASGSDQVSAAAEQVPVRRVGSASHPAMGRLRGVWERRARAGDSAGSQPAALVRWRAWLEESGSGAARYARAGRRPASRVRWRERRRVARTAVRGGDGAGGAGGAGS